MQTHAAVAAERFHPRVEAGFTVKLVSSGRSIAVRARDLSMAGLCLVGNPEIPLNRVTVAIPLPGDRAIVTGCQVKRRSNDAVALQFDQLDWDDLMALARFLHPRLP